MKSSSWISKFRAWATEERRPVEMMRLHEPRLAAVALARVMAQHPSGAVLAVAADASASEDLANAWAGIRELAGEKRPVIPLPEVAPGRRQWMPENEASRCAALQEARVGTPALYIASAATLLSETLSPKGFGKRVFSLKVGQKIDLEALAKRLVELDYDNEIEVTVPGEFARRGGILDVFSPLYADPVRMEFWGDEIESMRFFSAESQCSTQEIKEFRVIPRGASVLEEADASERTSVREYFSEEVPMVLCDPAEITAHLAEFGAPDDVARWEAMVSASPCVVRLETAGGASSGRLEAEALLASQGVVPEPELDVALLGEELTAALPELGEGGAALWHWQQLKSELKRWSDGGYEIVACCGGEGELERFRELLNEDASMAGVKLRLEHRELAMGLLFPARRLALLSDQEIFGRDPVRRRRRHVEYRTERRIDAGGSEALLDLEEGAYAVHVNYGICKYHGIHAKTVDGELLEAIELEFDEEARIFVPLDQAYLVSRYVGGTKNAPKLSRIGSSAWRNTKEKAEQAAWDLAAELLRIEAARASSPGFQFKPAVEWERSFAGAFPYELTPDQAAAVEACYQDMASPKPMNRLLCGDVGYGKTEVALRAAFRAVMNSRQVAVLVPTTVLAQQHYQTFSARLAEYPVRVEMLSRFKTAREQADILERLATGEVDIVIGTHRLVSKDVRFASLGLLIIDEEQRFGVQAKQRLKELRTSLDILTMTATPIPRTLYMSLSGLRNLSTIMTAPEHRMPVATVVATYDEELVRQAILKEVERGGQVFYLHNRVGSIQKVVQKLQAQMPNVRFCVGHGRMGTEELEAVMTDFVAHKYDVLVCTTIIESGIDIPNANTIIIDRADRYGLSELYQLRGRVGRYFRQAYAYLLLPPMGVLPQNARERLAAIKRFTSLGAGFRLAMKDLEIRGAGNILGQEQSGHIAAVGFDLYCDLLKEAVARLEKQPMASLRPVEVELEMVANSLTPVAGRLQATLPPEFIEDEATRLNAYKHFRALTTPEAVDAYGRELQDRFGALPECVKNLLAQHRIEALARQKHLLRLAVTHGRFVAETAQGLYRIGGKVPALYGATPAARLTETEFLLRRMPG